jgi:hypothetical protein
MRELEPQEQQLIFQGDEPESQLFITERVAKPGLPVGLKTLRCGRLIKIKEP